MVSMFLEGYDWDNRAATQRFEWRLFICVCRTIVDSLNKFHL